MKEGVHVGRVPSTRCLVPSRDQLDLRSSDSSSSAGTKSRSNPNFGFSIGSKNRIWPFFSSLPPTTKSEQPATGHQAPGTRNAFGLYVHIPFCRGKCAYCDFNSYPQMEEFYASYLHALKGEIELSRREGEFPVVTSIYLGGGTPTVYSAKDLVALLDILRATFFFDSQAEITVEANPETVDAFKLRELREGGFNRISIGFQSLDEKLLKTLGRRHSAKEAIQAYVMAREAGFVNINVDLILGIKGQSLSLWERTLEEAVSLRPEHISTYCLELKQEAGLLEEASEDEQAEMYELAISLLTAEGYRHYEISNFARESYECGHNLNYWQNGQYLGFGAGAHSHLGNMRYCNLESPSGYLCAVGHTDAVAEISILSTREVMEEEIFLGLRTTEGVGLQEFATKFGISLEDAFPGVSSDLISSGLLDLYERRGRLKLSKRGLFLANEVLSRFL